MRYVKALLVVFIALSAMFVINAPKAFAQQDGVDLHIMAEASNDNGASWHNWSGTEYIGGVTVTANPGDTILVRMRMWNTGTVNATTVQATGDATNANYIDSVSLVSADADGNGRSYDDYFFTFDSSGIGGISQVNANGSSVCNPNSGAECITLSLELSDNFPVGETIILGTATIHDYTATRQLIGFNPLGLFGIAQAEGTGRSSSFRIAVNVGELPATGQSTPIYLYFFGIIAAGVLARTYQIVRRKI